MMVAATTDKTQWISHVPAFRRFRKLISHNSRGMKLLTSQENGLMDFKFVNKRGGLSFLPPSTLFYWGLSCSNSLSTSPNEIQKDQEDSPFTPSFLWMLLFKLQDPHRIVSSFVV